VKHFIPETTFSFHDALEDTKALKDLFITSKIEPLLQNHLPVQEPNTLIPHSLQGFFFLYKLGLELGKN